MLGAWCISLLSILNIKYECPALLHTKNYNWIGNIIVGLSYVVFIRLTFSFFLVFCSKKGKALYYIVYTLLCSTSDTRIEQLVFWNTQCCRYCKSSNFLLRECLDLLLKPNIWLIISPQCSETNCASDYQIIGRGQTISFILIAPSFNLIQETFTPISQNIVSFFHNSVYLVFSMY